MSNRFKFTEARLMAVPPKERGIVNVWDAALAGHGARISKFTRSYIVRVKGGREITLGKVGHLGLEQARMLARAKLNEAYSGIAAPSDITLEDAFARYCTERKVRPSTVELRRKALKIHLKDWTKKKLADITPDMVARKFAGIKAPGMANVVMKSLSAIYTHAQATDSTLRENPVRALSRNKSWHTLEPREDRIARDGLAAFLNGTMEIDDLGLRGLIQFLLYTGCRKTESASIRWDDIDQKRNMIVIPGNRTKTGKPRLVPITEQLRVILANLPTWSDFLFPSKRSATGHVMDPSFAVAALQPGLTVHGLRRTWTSIAALHVPHGVLKSLGGWSAGNDIVLKHYVSVDDEALAAAAQTVANAIDAAMAPADNARASPTNIKRKKQA